MIRVLWIVEAVIILTSTSNEGKIRNNIMKKWLLGTPARSYKIYSETSGQKSPANIQLKNVPFMPPDTMKITDAILKLESPSNSASVENKKFIFDPLIAKCYMKNKGTKSVLDCPPLVNDPDFKNQWYLVPRPEPQFRNHVTVDLGILDVWIKYNFFGQGIVVVINDDGVETTHPDLKTNYNSKFGGDFCDNQDTPNPNPKGLTMRKSDTHGTSVAGIIGMEMNNGKCGVGVAPRVTLGAARVVCNSIRAPDKNMKSRGEVGDAILVNMQKVHITVNSYSSSRYCDEGKLPSGIPIKLMNAFERTASEGRGGLGTIHVFSAGNSRKDGFSCAFHVYGNSIHTILAAATNPWGGQTKFSARCAAIMISAPSSLLNPLFFPSIGVNGGCIKAFGGTSAVSPLVAGIISLTLNANPRLTGRDVQHLLASTSSGQRDIDYSSFVQNAAGFYVSHDYGFGMINAIRMVESAIKFETVPDLKTCIVPIKVKQSKFAHPNYFEKEVKTEACRGVYEYEVNVLEHVQLYVRMSYSEWRHLHIDLISPKRTKAQLLERELPNNSTRKELEWVFDSVMTWGESPRGTWKIKMYEKHEESGSAEKKNENYGNIFALELRFFGTRRKPKYFEQLKPKKRKRYMF